MVVLDIIQIIRSMVVQTSVSNIKPQGQQLWWVQLHVLYFTDNVFPQILPAWEEIHKWTIQWNKNNSDVNNSESQIAKNPHRHRPGLPDQGNLLEAGRAEASGGGGRSAGPGITGQDFKWKEFQMCSATTYNHLPSMAFSFLIFKRKGLAWT